MKIYAIRDTLADAILGGLHLFHHDAVAIRFFSDLASDPQTSIARHINDHDLIAVGTFDSELIAVEGFTVPFVVITGAAWKAAQVPLKLPDNNQPQLQLEGASL